MTKKKGPCLPISRLSVSKEKKTQMVSPQNGDTLGAALVGTVFAKNGLVKQDLGNSLLLSQVHFNKTDFEQYLFKCKYRKKNQQNWIYKIEQLSLFRSNIRPFL